MKLLILCFVSLMVGACETNIVPEEPVLLQILGQSGEDNSATLDIDREKAVFSKYTYPMLLKVSSLKEDKIINPPRELFEEDKWLQTYVYEITNINEFVARNEIYAGNCKSKNQWLIVRYSEHPFGFRSPKKWARTAHVYSVADADLDETKQIRCKNYGWYTIRQAEI